MVGRKLTDPREKDWDWKGPIGWHRNKETQTRMGEGAQ